VVSDFVFVHMHRMAQKAQRLRAFGENWRRQTARRARIMLAATAAETANCKFMSKMHRNTFGGRGSATMGPRLWNDLPPGLRRPGLTFRQSLVTHLSGDRSA